MAGLAFFFVLLPLSVILLLLAGFTKHKFFIYALGVIWGGLVLVLLLGAILRPFYTKKVLDKEDFYGAYVVDRDYFSGDQADWQYNHFRFEIREDDTFYFYETDGEKILKTYSGQIATTGKTYVSERLKIYMESPGHHVLHSNPTVYREPWNFFLVFKSTKFHNMYFRKGEWKPLVY